MPTGKEMHMKRVILLLTVLAVCLLGCGRTTTVFLAGEEEVELRGSQVIPIPVDPDAEEATEPAQEETTAQTQPEPTDYPETNKATVTKKATTTTKKKTNTATTTQKVTVTGTGNKKPAATEPKETEPPVTEPPVTEPPQYDIWDYEVGSLEYAMAERINGYRVAADLPELAFDEWLCAIASQRSFELSSVWSHTRPDGRGYATVLDDNGYGAGAVTELLVYDSGYGDGGAMADRWMESDSHRESLLGDYHTVGIGVYRTDGLTYVTCMLVG